MQPISRHDFEFVLCGLDEAALDFLLQAAYTLKAAQEDGDPRPPEVILGPLLAWAGIDWTPKEETCDHTT